MSDHGGDEASGHQLEELDIADPESSDPEEGAEEPMSETDVPQNRIREMQLQHAEELARMKRELEAAHVPYRIQLQQPPPPPRLKLFTGLPPTNSQEATFGEWRQQAMQILKDGALSDKSVHLKRSLRGAALQQIDVSGATEPKAIIDLLTNLFGELKTPEDRYMEICRLRPKKDQLLSEFLLTIYNQMEEVRQQANLTDEESHRRTYFALSKGCSNDLLAMELRNRFGIPGEATPEFSSLFRFIRQIEGLESSKARRAVPMAQSAAHVVDENRVQDSHSKAKAKNQGRYCYKCGEEGHMYKNCTRPPNPILVAKREREKRKKENEWRRRKGLPLLPEN